MLGGFLGGAAQNAGDLVAEAEVLLHELLLAGVDLAAQKGKLIGYVLVIVFLTLHHPFLIE